MSMKKLFLSIAALLAAGIYTADAQMWSFGPKAGVAISSANGVQDSRARAGLVAGVFAEVEMSDWFAVQGEILYSQQGFDSKTAGKNSRYQIDFITMPLVTKYYLIGGLNVQLGAQFGYLIRRFAPKHQRRNEPIQRGHPDRSGLRLRFRTGPGRPLHAGSYRHVRQYGKTARRCIAGYGRLEILKKTVFLRTKNRARLRGVLSDFFSYTPFESAAISASPPLHKQFHGVYARCRGRSCATPLFSRHRVRPNRPRKW